MEGIMLIWILVWTSWGDQPLSKVIGAITSEVVCKDQLRWFSERYPTHTYECQSDVLYGEKDDA